MVALNYDTNTAPPSEAFDIIPAGKYVAIVTQSEMRATKDGSGQYLWLEHEVIDGVYKGRKIWNNLNLQNSNPDTVRIAQQHLSGLALACGKTFVRDSAELHNIPVIINVKARPAGPDKNGIHRDAQNNIAAYSSMTGAATMTPITTAPAAPAAPAAVAPAAPRGTTPPWRKTA